MTDPLMHGLHLPVSEAKLRTHFAAVTSATADADRHLEYFRASLNRLAEFEAAGAVGDPAAVRRARQVEKDERFWTVSKLLDVYYSPDRVAGFTRLLARAFGARPPVEPFDTWEEALEGPLHVLFEVNLPSPPSYRAWLQDHLDERVPIPYLREAAAKAGTRLEGATHVDALLLSEQTGFAIVFEAKVLSDIDGKVAFDVMRDQIARNVDVMLDRNPRLVSPLHRRDPGRTCFALLTPALFKENPHSRFYGLAFERYKQDQAALAAALPHRSPDELAGVHRRLGWATFEDCTA